MELVGVFVELKNLIRKYSCFLSRKVFIVNHKIESLILFFFSIILIFGFFIEPIFNPDIGWHLSIGKYIVENLKIPYTDFLSWTFAGKEWINTEWLVDVIYYLFFIFWGYEGLYFLKLFNIFLISLAVYFYFIIAGINMFNLLWIIPSLFLFSESVFTLRPDNYSVLFFILAINLVELVRIRNVEKKHYVLASLLFLLWVNMHGAYFYGLVLIGIYLFSSIITENLSYIYGNEKKIYFNSSKTYFYLLLFSFFSTLLNPHGYKIYSTIFDHFYLIEKIEVYISEWKNTDFFDSLSLKYGFVSTIVFLIAYLVKFIKQRKLNLVDVFLLFFFILSGALHVRLIVFSSIITHFVFIRYFKDELNSYLRYIMVGLFFLFYVYVGLYENFFNFYYNYTVKDEENYYTNLFLSKGTVKFIEENYDFFKDKKMFNDWNSGGELGWRFNGRIKVFMDGRYIFIPLLEEQYIAFSSVENWRIFSNAYGIDYAVISNASIMKKKIEVKKDSIYIRRPIYLRFFDKKNWSLVYFDFRNIIIVNNEKFPKDFLEKYKYNCLLPNDEEFMIYELENNNRVDCYKKDLVNYLRRELNNKDSFSFFYIEILRELKEYENERKRDSKKSSSKSRRDNIKILR